MKTYYPYLDLLKYVCCIGIVCIHTLPFHFMPVIDGFFDKFQSAFVAIFFLVSSSLFWQKIRWNNEDFGALWHFVSRLLILVVLWGIILLPHWLPKFIRHNPDDWMLLLLPKMLIQGFAQGSWFILSLIYGILLCYLLNRYLNRHLVFAIGLCTWLYFSLVHYEGMSDFLHIYWEEGGDDGFHFESYCSVVRAFVWIEFGFYLVPKLLKMMSGRSLLSVVMLSMVALAFVDSGYFLLMTILPICAAAFSMSVTSLKPDERLMNLRKMSVIIYFAHFPIATTFHVLYTKEIIPWEYGLTEFFITFTLVSVFAYVLIRLSKNYKVLRYLY